MTRRGSAIHQAYAERLTAERLQQHAVGGCVWCPTFRVEGTLAETRAATLEHRQAHHPEALSTRLKKRARPFQTTVSHKSLDENIANARTQGASSGEA